MGEHDTLDHAGKEQMREFVRALLNDVQALERMINDGMFETGIRRVGAEQEFFLVDAGGEPAPVAMEVLQHLPGSPFTTELARFNLEANLPPYEFRGSCLRQMEDRLRALFDEAEAAAGREGAELLLTGILPTLEKSDLTMANITPAPRYAALNEALVRMRGGKFQIHLKGIDDLYTVHDNVMTESCNTSFQIHFQVNTQEFAPLYNVAQAVTAPVLAAAVNSPLFLGRRLWHETRVALFQHAVDPRNTAMLTRGESPRVHFGDEWVEKSVLDIFREDIARYRVVLATEVEERSLEVLDQGRVPELKALRLHNGTVYRWNRPCYGIHEGQAHLRIENRVLPAGPTILDEMANAAFFFGLMSSISHEIEDITRVLSFSEAKANFIAAARLGLKAQFTWLDHRAISAQRLILEELLPLARRGLERNAIEPADISRYLDVIQGRVERSMTGAQWMLDSFSSMENKGSDHDRCRALTLGIMSRQREGKPVHTWSPAALDEISDWRHSYQTVGQFMTRELFTVRPDDLVDLAANLMDWEHIRHVPVEDDHGRLVGLLSHRALIRLLAKGQRGSVAVREIMKVNPLTVAPDTSSLEAIEIMRTNQVACLPVVQDDKLVGLLTERDLIAVSAKLLDQQLRDFKRR